MRMSIYAERLWSCLKEKAELEDAGLPESEKCAESYLAGMRTVCNFAVDLAKTIRDFFPMYTLHDETHICNVLRKMAQLLGEQGVAQLSRDEAAMLILAACCHDLGMSCSEEQLELENDPVRLERYCNDHPGAYVKMKEQKEGEPLSDDLLRDFLRAFHHERVLDILTEKEWPTVLNGKVRRSDLVDICRSHGKDAQYILDLKPTTAVDVRMCGIMLRLADILDFDSSRAPQAVYDDSGFHGHGQDRSAAYSKEEWEKHMSSHGFRFELVEDRAYPYELPYGATCPNMQIEQAVNTYLDWVDRELAACLNMLSYCREKWRSLVLPRKVRREIEPTDYVSGQFRFALDQNKVLDLLVGDNLYQDPGVFVRELVQNAIDAVRTRQKMDRRLPASWKPQINIRCWMDEEGYHWFRIEDNGTGMNREIVEKYFLKVGSSYYASDDFRRDKYRNEVEPGYQPISRFGIGILSCFMGDRERSRVEVSTLYYERNSTPLRMSLPGLTGYYYLATRDQCPHAQEMKGKLPQEQKAYRSAPGTSIAVRTNLYLGGSYRSFREILDRYVVFPEVPIHYEDEHGSYDYPTEQELMAAMHAVAPDKDGALEFSLTQEQIRKVESELPGVKILESPKAVVKCVCLDRSKFLSGAVLLSKVEGGRASCRMQLGKETVEPDVKFSLAWDGDALHLKTALRFSSEFQQRMQLLREQVDCERHKFHEVVEREQDALNQENLNGLWRGCDREKEWLEHFQHEWDCSPGEVRKRIASVQKTYQQLQTDDRRMLEEYRNSLDSHKTQLCDLGTFDWYREFWREARFRVEKDTSVAAHNGVRCSDAGFLVKARGGNRTQAILLLKDGYRPELDVSRTKLQRLPLAADLEFAVLRREWALEGFAVSKDDLGETEYWRIPGSRYLEVMDKRPDLKERLRVKTDHGAVSLQEIPALFRRFPEIEILDCPGLHSSRSNSQNRSLYEYCILACLRRDHTLLGRDGSLWLRPASTDHSRDWEEFPPSFFLPVEGRNRKLTKKNSYFRHYCNEAHPLSDFLIRNRAWLEAHTPGLFREIMESLAEDNDIGLILTVNRCLERLQEYSGDKPQVPEGAFLTEEDFW